MFKKLISAGVLALSICGWNGLAQSARGTENSATKTKGFEVASVRLMEDRDKLPIAQQMYSMSPSGAAEFSARNITMPNLIYFAFKLTDVNQIAGTPGWMGSTYYELAAKPEGEVGLSYDQLEPLLQELLKERFHLAYHREMKDFKGYRLVVVKGGAKLIPATSAASHAYLMTGRIDAAGAPVSLIAILLSHAVGEPVVDKTGLKGNFDMTLNFAPMEDTDSTLPSLPTALEEQMGLKLEKQMVPVEMFVIDHVDRTPTAN